MIQIKRAVREKVFLKLVAMGPAGSGKTYGTIGLAKGLAPTGKVLVVDTENSSASYYADKWDFDVVDMHAPFTSQKYMEVLQEAVRLGYEVIVIDSMSHEWAASGGVLDKKADFDRQKGEKWGNWQDAKKPHALFKEAWLQAPIHVIATMRSKMEYVLEMNEKGKQVPRKVGLAPIQDGDSEYEFGVAFEIDRDSHLATAAKDRTGLFDGRSFPLNEAIGQELAAWLATGATPSTTPAPATATQATASPSATVETRATKPGTQSAAQPVAQGAKSAPINQAVAENPSPASAPATPTGPSTSTPTGEPTPEWTALIADLAAVTLATQMPEKSRQKLLDLWMAEDQSKPEDLRQEIATIRSTIKTETVSESLQASQTDALARKDAPGQEAATFVDGLECEEAAGGISPEQYQALNHLIGAFNIDRNALRLYCDRAGHLLHGKNGPTLARMKAEAFTKLRDRLLDKTLADKKTKVTKSQRTVEIINATQPMPLAS